MYRVMLVDDEPIIIRGMKALLKWEQEGYEICGHAYSAKEALDKVDELNPDIIITDLVMPEMDGNEFIEIVKSKRPSIEAIILSGFGEFEFARKALGSGVSDYLMKPATREQLKKALKKAADKITLSRSSQMEYIELKARMQESMPLLESRYILEILKGKIKDKEEILRRCSLIGFEIKGNSLIGIMESKGRLDIEDEENSDVYYDLAAKAICLEHINKLGKGYAITEGQKLCLIGTDFDKQMTENMMYELLNDICSDIKCRYGVEATIGMGSSFKNITDIKKSYFQALYALETSFFIGVGQVIHHGNVLEYDDEIMSYPVETADKLIEKIRYDAKSVPKQLASELIDEFVKKAGHDIETIYQFCCHFYIQLSNLNKSVKAGTSAGYDTSYDMDKIRSCKTTSQLKQHFEGVIEARIIAINKLRAEKLNSVVSKVIDYVNSNLSADLTLNEMANIVFVNSVYLSTLFKSKTGQMYHDFVFCARMKKAQELLLDEQLKVYEVAQNVGYSNARSFSDAFKRFCGMTPSKYVNTHVNK